MVKAVELCRPVKTSGWHQNAAYLKELDVCVEKVSLGDMNPLDAKLMDKAQDPSSDDSFSADTASLACFLHF